MKIMRAPVLIAAIACCADLAAQSAGTAAFEVASVKQSTAQSRFRFAVTATSLTAHNVPLGYCIRWAYGLRLYQRFQLEGPDWLEPGADCVRYDIDAKTAGPMPTAEMRVLMQGLLALRWKLAVHYVTKTEPAYILKVAKSGPKLQESQHQGDMEMKPRGTAFEFVGASMAQLAETMEPQVAAVLVDETGLSGRYDFTLEDYMKYSDYAIPIPGSRAADFGPAINQALRELGLTLELEKRPLKILVVDRAEKKPADN